MKFVKLTKASGDEAGQFEWVNLFQCVTMYTDAEGTFLVQADDAGSLCGPFKETPEQIIG